jgi:hypothetical protein
MIGFFAALVSASAQEVVLTVKLDSTGTGSGSAATGSGYMILSSDRMSVRYHFVVNKLSGPVTAAHFHLLPSGLPVQAITFTGNEANGTWSLPDSVFANMFSEKLYVNVHTAAASGGEIRGTPQPHQLAFRVDLDGAQAGTSSNGKGAGTVHLGENMGNLDGLRYRFTYSGLNGPITAAHFHALPTGGVVHTVTFTDSTADGSWTSVPDSIWWKLYRGQIYLNIHTSFATGGEIRGTLRAVGEAPFVGMLNGAQAGTASPGRGTVWAVLRPDASVRYAATYNRLTGTISGSHFHESRTSSVIYGVTFNGNHTSGTWPTLTDQNIADLFQGRVYLNVHSSTSSGGEIRGNLESRDGAVTGELTGAAASTPSTAKGTIWGGFMEDSLQYSVTVAGLSSAYTGSHFHLAPGGSVLQGVPLVDSTVSGMWGYGNYLLDLLRGDIYFNVHTANYTGGEIRANLTIGTGIATSVEPTSDVLPESFSLGQNYPNPFNPSTTIDYTVAASGRVSLTVFNILGQQVATIFDHISEPGSFRTTFDASRLPSGVYIYRLKGERSAPIARRMVLLK